MNGVPGLDGVVQLAEVVRDGFIESRHFGLAVLRGPDEQILYAAGRTDATVLPRSTAKPLQAVAVANGLDAEQVAVAAGSHTGEDRHVAVVDAILAKARLDRSALQCPPDRPEDEATRHRLIAAGSGPERVRMNCSGKHAAMLAATVASGNDPATYLDPAGPVQRQVAAELSRLGGEPITVTTTDGCGAPLFGLSLTGLARAFSRLATAPSGTPEAEVATAMRTHPELVGGTGHLNSTVMQRLPGTLAKGGAEGVLALATPDGHAVAVKVIDGSPRATTAIALTLLARTGIDVPEDLRTVPVLGGGHPVGAVRPTL